MHASSVLNSQVLRLNLEYFALHLSWRCEFFKLFHHQCHGTPDKELKVPYRTAELPINGGKSVSLQRCPAAAAVILSHFVTNTLCEKIVVFSTDCRCIWPTIHQFPKEIRGQSAAKKDGGKLWNGVCQPLEDGERPTAKAIGKIGVFNLWSWIKFHFEKFVKL